MQYFSFSPLLTLISDFTRIYILLFGTRVLSLGQFYPPGGIWQYLEILVVPTRQWCYLLVME